VPVELLFILKLIGKNEWFFCCMEHFFGGEAIAQLSHMTYLFGTCWIGCRLSCAATATFSSIEACIRSFGCSE
jgi:hypothetical protein